MKENIQKLSSLTFAGIFAIFIFSIVTSKPSVSKTNNASVRFDKNFSGIATVIDGDSITVNDGSSVKQVRLFGIDAPEFKQTCFNAKDEEYNCGINSVRFLFNLADQKKVTCYYGQKDVYNRFLAKCNLGRISISQELVKHGMAIIYDYRQSSTIMKNIEKSAKIRRKGIWQGKFQNPKDYRKSHPYKK